MANFILNVISVLLLPNILKIKVHYKRISLSLLLKLAVSIFLARILKYMLVKYWKIEEYAKRNKTLNYNS
jgi:hypothetical protein